MAGDLGAPRLSETAMRMRPGVFSELQTHIDAYAARGGELVPLHIGDTYLAPPPSALFSAAIASESDDALYRYGATAALPALRSAIAARLARRGFPDVDGARHVLVGVGATHALACAARAVFDPGDDVLMVAPYWPISSGVFQGASARPIEVPLTSRLYENPELDAGRILASAITPRTRAIYFSTPNNPDGKVLSAVHLAQIADVAREHDLWVFADEVYSEQIFDASRTPHVSIATLPGMRDRTITLYSFSKSHALAGARVGCAIASEDVVATARRISTYTVFNVPVAMQRSALLALDDDPRFLDTSRATYRRARDEAARALDGANVRFSLAEGGSYLFLDFTSLLKGRPLNVLLEQAIARGVLLAPGDASGPSYASWARLCYTSVPLPRLLDGIARLRAAIDAI